MLITPTYLRIQYNPANKIKSPIASAIVITRIIDKSERLNVRFKLMK